MTAPFVSRTGATVSLTGNVALVLSGMDGLKVFDSPACADLSRTALISPVRSPGLRTSNGPADDLLAGIAIHPLGRLGSSW